LLDGVPVDDGQAETHRTARPNCSTLVIASHGITLVPTGDGRDTPSARSTRNSRPRSAGTVTAASRAKKASPPKPRNWRKRTYPNTGDSLEPAIVAVPKPEIAHIAARPTADQGDGGSTERDREDEHAPERRGVRRSGLDGGCAVAVLTTPNGRTIGVIAAPTRRSAPLPVASRYASNPPKTRVKTAIRTAPSARKTDAPVRRRRFVAIALCVRSGRTTAGEETAVGSLREASRRFHSSRFPSPASRTLLFERAHSRT
jgi:hypothetical protein